MEGHAVSSHEVPAAYVADAACAVEGVHVHDLVDGPRRHPGVRVVEEDDATTVELQIALETGATAPGVGTAVQARVAEYLVRTAPLSSVAVDVGVAGIAADGN